MKYFVTGATGFIGGRVAEMLAADGHEVIALVRDPTRAQQLAAQGIRLAAGDITDKASLRAPMTGVDGVYHIAGWYKIGQKDNRAGAAINIDGTRNVLEMMRELNIPKGVYTSTLAVNSDTGGRMVDESHHYTGPHLSEYDRTKYVAHHEVAAPMARAGLPLVTVMPGLVYGPGDTSTVRPTLIQYLQGRLPVLPLKTAYAWAHVDDIARAHILAMDKGRTGEDYIIAGPVHTLIDAFTIAESITRIPAPRIHVAPGLMKVGSALAGLAENFITLPETYTAEGLRITAGVTYIGSNEKARRELGYDPRPLAVGLRETLEHELQLLELQRTQ